MPETRSKTTKKIEIELLVPHPLNAEIYSCSAGDDDELRRAIINNNGELIHDPVVHLRRDGRLVEYRILSGHRRIRIKQELGHEHIECVVWEGLTDADEMLMLFGANVGRDMKTAYKVRFYKALKQFLRQHKNSLGESSAYSDEDMTEHPFVHAVDGLLVSDGKLRIWEIIEQLVGFSKREQETLTHVCDEDYRAMKLKELATVTNLKTATDIAAKWAQLETALLDGEVEISDVDKEVKKLNKHIELLKNPPKGEVKKIKKQTPLRTEKGTTTNASIHANTIQNADKFLSEKIESLGILKKENWVQIQRMTLVSFLNEWAQLVMEELK